MATNRLSYHFLQLVEGFRLREDGIAKRLGLVAAFG